MNKPQKPNKSTSLQKAKGGDALLKLKQQMLDKEQHAKDLLAEKLRKEEAFRASVGLPTGKHSEKKRAASTSASSSEKPDKSRTNVEVWRPNLDVEIFAVAMSGVEKLSTKKAGAASRVKPSGPSASVEKSGARARRAAAEGDDKLAVRWPTEQRCEAARRGAEFALEALQRFVTPDDVLDLHGRESAEARTRVAEFVRSRRARKLKVLEIVHGAGRNSPDGYPVLRDAVVAELCEAPTSRELDAFCSTDRGASIVVALKRG
jgi:DNA-nicking Smr family endonuclease